MEAPCDGRLSRTVLREVWGEIPRTYSTRFSTIEYSDFFANYSILDPVIRFKLNALQNVFSICLVNTKTIVSQAEPYRSSNLAKSKPLFQFVLLVQVLGLLFTH